MNNKKKILGVDVGSVTISIAQINGSREVEKTSYSFHSGKIKQTLIDRLRDFNIEEVELIAVTSSTPPILNGAITIDSQLALINGVKSLNKKVGSILHVGGERFSLIQFDKEGAYRKSRTNTSCAAGTGSFLDQQARRLSLAGIEELSTIAFYNEGDIPKIASRCAVFAKTDLIHAQQEGYSLDEICDGLCKGLANNIVDTLIAGEVIEKPVFFVGGVAKNPSVTRHLEDQMGARLYTDDYSHLYGAIGAAVTVLDENNGEIRPHFQNQENIIRDEEAEKNYFYEQLELKLSAYPDFTSCESYNFIPTVVDFTVPVEVDVYEVIENSTFYNVYLGIDIGSTSTKAVLLGADNRAVAGFYTRTAGRPLEAVQSIFEAIDDVFVAKSAVISIAGCGTTGSGRKFIGRLIGADQIIDEITAHARAAVELNPDVDTIIEIGGQDSKFTTLRNGMVNFSVMNTVCAAGTGSFIEEQAQKLECAIEEYASRTAGVRSPIASDRCTVFMERDINHFLNRGYSTDEILATALHSVRDNYLSKVAVEAAIGDHICFQGATAKNKSLVAAFEQKLEKPIFVSKYCHLTGALGVALGLKDSAMADTSFKGIVLYRQSIPIQSEICDLCTNHCKIKKAVIDGETVAYGFLCGRDYDTKKFINRNLSGFDLARERKKAFYMKHSACGDGPVVGLPAALHLYEELPLWKRFFDYLGIITVTSEEFPDAVKTGKKLTGAEFCAPIAALHGHVAYLAGICDYIFLPFYHQDRHTPKDKLRQYCYYTHYAPALITGLEELDLRQRCITPLLNYIFSTSQSAMQLYNALKPLLKDGIGVLSVQRAMTEAVKFYEQCAASLKNVYNDNRSDDDISIVLLGRPYTVLLPSMNKGIPEIFSSMGIRTFYQDMVPYSDKDTEKISDLLKAIHWKYAATILETAEVLSKRPGVYPVFITSFKCSPDSFITEYFKRIMDRSEKPYLVLQLDEHDSSVGYETRIEAAIRAFRNHSRKATKTRKRYLPVNPCTVKEINGKTLLIPNWDDITGRLIVANLRHHGIDARLLKENSITVQKSMRHNTGQCIPMNAIAQEFIDYIEFNKLDPSKTLLWMMQSDIACNIRLFPYYIKSILEGYGKGFERTEVYSGEITFIEMGPIMAVNIYFVYMFSGILKRMGCRVRPYEINRGETDAVVEKSIRIFEQVFQENGNREEAVRRVITMFEAIEVREEQRPKVAIFGDIYVRDNSVMNQNLIRAIENAGGEVITTPYSEYVKMLAPTYFYRWKKRGQYLDVIANKTLLMLSNRLERKYYRLFQKVLKEDYPEYNQTGENILTFIQDRFNIRLNHGGESLDNLIKIFWLMHHYPDIALMVQASPAFCCPSLISEAMAKNIEKYTGVPIVSITYDGTESYKNDIIIPYLRYPRNRSTNVSSYSGFVSS